MYETFDQCEFHDGIWALPNDFPFPNSEPVEPSESFGAFVDEWANPLTKWMEEEFVNNQFCPYCRTILRMREYNLDEDGDYGGGDFSGWWVPDIASLRSCIFCGYWQWYSLFEYRGGHGRAGMSVLSEFDPKVPLGVETELAQHLRRNEELWTALTPVGMERLVAAIFKANHSDAEVIHVGRPGDKGVDVIFIESDGKKWLIQVKRREKLRTVEGFDTYLKLLGAVANQGELRGIAVSNASHFSVQSRREAARQPNYGRTIELIDRGKLNRMLNPLIPRMPWMSFLEQIAPDELRNIFERDLPQNDPDQLDLFKMH